MSTFAFTHIAATDDALYIAGVARDLEDRDVHHCILWERVSGAWKRLQWKNRCFGLTAYGADAASVAVYMGFDGRSKVRSTAAGSSEEIIDDSGDGPSRLRPLGGIRRVGDHLFVCGMRRMVYRRALCESAWARADEGVRLAPSDLDVVGLNAIDGDERGLVAVGGRGAIWAQRDGRWQRCEAATSERLAAVRCLPRGISVAAGQDGALLVSSGGEWTRVPHAHEREAFSAIEAFGDRVFVASESGAVYELELGGRAAMPRVVPTGLPRAFGLFATSGALYLLAESSVAVLTDRGVGDVSPPSDLLA